jgi:hypothetical protein
MRDALHTFLPILASGALCAGCAARRPEPEPETARPAPTPRARPRPRPPAAPVPKAVKHFKRIAADVTDTSHSPALENILSPYMDAKTLPDGCRGPINGHKAPVFVPRTGRAMKSVKLYPGVLVFVDPVEKGRQGGGDMIGDEKKDDDEIEEEKDNERTTCAITVNPNGPNGKPALAVKSFDLSSSRGRRTPGVKWEARPPGHGMLILEFKKKDFENDLNITALDLLIYFNGKFHWLETFQTGFMRIQPGDGERSTLKWHRVGKPAREILAVTKTTSKLINPDGKLKTGDEKMTWTKVHKLYRLDVKAKKLIPLRSDELQRMLKLPELVPYSSSQKGTGNPN